MHENVNSAKDQQRSSDPLRPSRRTLLSPGATCRVLALGFAMTIGVAWACVMRRAESAWIDDAFASGQSAGMHQEDGTVSAFVWNGLGVTIIRVHFDSAKAVNLRESTLSHDLLPSIDRWRSDLLNPRSQSIGSAWSTHYACGLPLRCIEGSDFDEAWPEPVRLGLVKLGQSFDHRRIMPVRPRPIELAVNTLFWSALLLVVLLVTRTMIAKRRGERGLCPHCAYDRRGDFTRPCPECGWSVVHGDPRPDFSPRSQP